MISPHTVIETIYGMGPKHPWWRSPQTLPPILHLLNHAVFFRFGNLVPSMEHKEFGCDLYEKGLFKLPFPVTAFGFSGIPYFNRLVQTQQPASALMVLAENDKGLSAVMCSEMRSQDGKAMGGIPIGIVMNATFANASEGSVNVVEETYPILADHPMAMMYGSADKQGYTLMRERLLSNLVGGLGMAVMLMSKGVVTEHSPAPRKLNIDREKRGRPRINDSYTVKLSAGDVRTIYTDGGEESIAGHRRGSPRLHWRRGHFRTLRRGTETEMVIPIPPTLIGGNEAADAIRKAYDVS